jgi:hypothetical protein
VATAWRVPLVWLALNCLRLLLLLLLNPVFSIVRPFRHVPDNPKTQTLTPRSLLYSWHTVSSPVGSIALLHIHSPFSSFLFTMQHTMSRLLALFVMHYSLPFVFTVQLAFVSLTFITLTFVMLAWHNVQHA